MEPVSPKAMEDALQILRDGGVVVHATETCYGLACDMTNPEAVATLFALKQRPLDQPVSALFPTVAAAMEWVEWNEEAQLLADSHLPGPLTMILPLRKELFPTPGGGNTVGVRVSPHTVAHELAPRFGNPISTTSANLHGEENPYTMKQLEDQYRNEALQPDLILDSGPLPEAPPSTVMNLTEPGTDILRKGSIS